MPVETPSLFSSVIQHHLQLKQQNARLEEQMPLRRYLSGDPFGNHPLFKTEEQARLEETADDDVVAHVATLPWPGDDGAEHAPDDADDGLWSRSRDFDWGD